MDCGRETSRSRRLSSTTSAGGDQWAAGFRALDFDDPAFPDAVSDSPVSLGVRGGAVEITDLRIYRDIYYTQLSGQHAARLSRDDVGHEAGTG